MEQSVDTDWGEISHLHRHNSQQQGQSTEIHSKKSECLYPTLIRIVSNGLAEENVKVKIFFKGLTLIFFYSNF